MKRTKEFFRSALFRVIAAIITAIGVGIGIVNPAAAAILMGAVLATAIESQGTVVAFSFGGSPTSFTTIPNVTDFSGPGGQASVIDATNLLSVQKEKMMGLSDAGQLTFNVNFDPDSAVHQQIRQAWVTRQLCQFRITFADGTPANCVFDGYVLGFQISGGVDAVVKAAITVEITGALTWS